MCGKCNSHRTYFKEKVTEVKKWLTYFISFYKQFAEPWNRLKKFDRSYNGWKVMESYTHPRSEVIRHIEEFQYDVL